MKTSQTKASEAKENDRNAQFSLCCTSPAGAWALVDQVHITNIIALVKRKFHVTLLEHDEGVSVSCPELPGCHSQGSNVDEALANIGDAIRDYIDLYGQPETRCEIREMEVITA